MIAHQTRSGHTPAGLRLSTDDYPEDGRLFHSVAFPSGPIDCIGFRSDYVNVRVGHEALLRAAASDDPTAVLLAVARNRRFYKLEVVYR